MRCKNMACFCTRSPAAVRGPLSCQARRLRWGFQTALHAPLCHLKCLSLSLCLRLSVSPGLSAQRHSAMMGFSDGIKMSRPTAVTHANCIVYRFYRWEQPAVCFVWRLFIFFVMMSLSVAPLRLSLRFQTGIFLIWRSLSLFLCCRFTATPTWPPTASTISTHGKCFRSPQSRQDALRQHLSSGEGV